MAPRSAAILSTIVVSLVGLFFYVVVSSAPRPAACDRVGSKGEERISPTSQHEWFDGQCWTTTPQPPRDRPASDIYRPQPGQRAPK
jgi:hypothetical protein